MFTSKIWYTHTIIVHLIPPIPTAFSVACTRSPSMREEPAGGHAAWSAASTVPCDECGESNLLQLKDDILSP
jgi:hypothetical protein